MQTFKRSNINIPLKGFAHGKIFCGVTQSQFSNETKSMQFELLDF